MRYPQIQSRPASKSKWRVERSDTIRTVLLCTELLLTISHYKALSVLSQKQSKHSIPLKIKSSNTLHSFSLFVCLPLSPLYLPLRSFDRLKNEYYLFSLATGTKAVNWFINTIRWIITFIMATPWPSEGNPWSTVKTLYWGWNARMFPLAVKWAHSLQVN